MPDKPKVKWFESKNKLAEIYQSINMKFSFATRKDNMFIQCHEWVKCRDFLHDAVRTALTGTKSNIYGFKFEKGINPDLDLNNTIMLVSQKNLKVEKIFLANLTKSLSIINYYETLHKEKLSKLTKVEGNKEANYEHIWVIEGPKFWMTTPYLISLFTFFLRLGAKNIGFKTEKDLKEKLNKIVEDKNDNDNDANYLRYIWDKLNILAINYPKLVAKNKNSYSNLYFKSSSISDFHNRSGIVSTCKVNTWSKEFNKKLKKII